MEYLRCQKVYNSVYSITEETTEDTIKRKKEDGSIA